MTQKPVPKGNYKFGRLYRFVRGAVRLFTHKIETVWQTPFRGNPSVFVANHDRAYGPIAMCAYFDLRDNTSPWINAQVLHSRGMPNYIRKDYWWDSSKWYSSILSHTYAYLCSWILPPILRGSACIPVYHDHHILKTTRKSLKALKSGRHILLFPEIPKGYHIYDDKIMDGFVSIGRMYYAKTKQNIDFYPTYVDWNNKTITIGNPITYDHDANYKEHCHEVASKIEEYYKSFK